MLLEIAFASTSNTSFRSLSPAVALDVCELFCASSENVRRPRKHPQSRSDLYICSRIWKIFQYNFSLLFAFFSAFKFFLFLLSRPPRLTFSIVLEEVFPSLFLRFFSKKYWQKEEAKRFHPSIRWQKEKLSRYAFHTLQGFSCETTEAEDEIHHYWGAKLKAPALNWCE